MACTRAAWPDRRSARPGYLRSYGSGRRKLGQVGGEYIVGVASTGARKLYRQGRDDDLGGIFAHDIRAANVAFDTEPAIGDIDGAQTIAVTLDGERTMNTFLGAAQDLTTADIDEALVASAAITYLEGYLWDPPHEEAFVKRRKSLTRINVALRLHCPMPFALIDTGANFSI